MIDWEFPSHQLGISMETEKHDVIIGTSCLRRKAYIFFGGITGTKDSTDADVILDASSLSIGNDFGDVVASAGDFNGDGKDDVIVRCL